MSIEEIKVRYKWKYNFTPFLKIDHCIIKAFTNQYVFTLSLLSNLLWFEIQFSNLLTSFKIGIHKMYFIIGGGANE